MKKRIVTLFLTICFCITPLPVIAAPAYASTPDAASCILMDAKTGAVLYEYHADDALPPASVTKVMTMLLLPCSSFKHFAVKREHRCTNMVRSANAPVRLMALR